MSAQDPQSDIPKKGSFFYVEDYIPIGSAITRQFVPKIYVAVRRSKDIATGEKASVISVVYTVNVGANLQGQRGFDINRDEIDELIAAMIFMRDKIFPVIPDVSKDSLSYDSSNNYYAFKSDHFEIGCYLSFLPTTWGRSDKRVWEGYINKNSDCIHFNQEDFIAILSLFQQAKLKL